MGGAAAYAQPTPRLLYIHDDLSDDVGRDLGPGSRAATLVRELLDLLARDRERVRVLTLHEQVEHVIAQGAHAPFEITVGIGAAGQRVARTLHERTGWFPRVRRIGLTREEDGAGGYRLVSTEAEDLKVSLDDLADCASLAVVDDTVFSGLTMRSLIEALPPALRARTHAFCLRGVAGSIAAIATLCPITAGVAAPGRLLEDVSFINASGLVRRVAIRRPGQPPLAFFDRPDWIRAWFPTTHREVLALCEQLNALLEPHPHPSPLPQGRGSEERPDSGTA
jgi:adenine/guanine phosphoribosyltransferase-like PRPP-binding protein